MIGLILLHIFVSAGVLWILLRLLAKDEADLSMSRYPIFGAVYWFALWFLTMALQWGLWAYIPLTLMTVYALYQFFYVTMVKSLWLGILFVVIRTAVQVGGYLAMNAIVRSVQT